MTRPAGPFHPVIAQAIVDGVLPIDTAPTVGYSRDQMYTIGRRVIQEVFDWLEPVEGDDQEVPA